LLGESDAEECDVEQIAEEGEVALAWEVEQGKDKGRVDRP